MLPRSSKKLGGVDKQQIVNYQFQILEQGTPLAKPTISNSDKFSFWDLESKVKAVVGEKDYQVRWIGNSDTAYLETYAEILLIGTGYSQSNILEFKHNIYKLGRECLTLPQQKLLVQFLCLIEYSRDRYSFLNKYPQIEAIFIKILQYIEDEQPRSEDSAGQVKKKAKVRRKGTPKIMQKSVQKQKRCESSGSNRSINSFSQQTEYEKELEEIYQGFNKHFDFISILGSNQYSCTLKLFQSKKIFVVIEKQCYFMVEIIDKAYDSAQFTLGDKNRPISDMEAAFNPNQRQVDEVRNFQQIVKFNKDQFQYILQYKNEVQESCVTPVERASQIRKPLKRDLGTPKFPKNDTIMHPLLNKEPETMSYIDKIEHQNTFIDDLLTNTVMINEAQTNKSGDASDISNKVVNPNVNKKQKIMDKMKEIQSMKEALKEVRQRIQNKIKKIDEVQNMKIQINNKNAEKRQSQKTDTNKSQHKYKEIDQNKTRQQEKINHVLYEKLKKQRKKSYNIPINNADRKNLDDLAKNNRKSTKPGLKIFEKMLSQKAISRPQSKMRSANESMDRKYCEMYFSPMVSNRKNSLDVTVMQQPMPSNNLNVNVNVSINENMLNPHFNSHQQAYKRNFTKEYVNRGLSPPNQHTNYATQYYIQPPPPPKSPISHKYLHTPVSHQKIFKTPNPQRSVTITMNKDYSNTRK